MDRKTTFCAGIKIKMMLLVLAIAGITIVNPFSVKERFVESSLDVFEFLVKYFVGAPDYDYLAGHVGLYSHDHLTEIAERLNRASENRRVKDIRVIRSNQINVFAMFDGHIVLHSGIFQLLDNEDELACTIAHEAGHLEKRHVTRDLFKLTGMGMPGDGGARGINESAASAKYEMEADLTGMELMLKAGYDPGGCLDLMRRILSVKWKAKAKPEFFSTHPSEEMRMKYMVRWLEENVRDDAPRGTNVSSVRP